MLIDIYWFSEYVNGTDKVYKYTCAVYGPGDTQKRFASYESTSAGATAMHMYNIWTDARTGDGEGTLPAAYSVKSEYRNTHISTPSVYVSLAASTSCVHQDRRITGAATSSFSRYPAIHRRDCDFSACTEPITEPMCTSGLR